MTQLFFQVNEVKQVAPDQRFDPVFKKIMDVNIYEGQQLVHSSVAKRYLQLQQEGKIIDERQNQKIKRLSAERDYLAFPTPVIPLQQLDIIKNMDLQAFFKGYLNKLPSHIIPTKNQSATSNPEELPFYQALESNTVPYARENKEFVQDFNELVQLVGARFETLSLGDFMVFFRFIAQIPFVPPFSLQLKPLYKRIQFDRVPGLIDGLRLLFDIEILQNLLSSSVTRRWSKDPYSLLTEQLDTTNQGNERDDIVKQLDIYKKLELEKFQNHTDLLFSHFFSYIKMLYNIQVINAKLFSLFVTVACGSHSFAMQDLWPFIFKQDSIAKWLVFQIRQQKVQRKYADLFSFLAERGFFKKLGAMLKHLDSFSQLNSELTDNFCEILEITIHVVKNSKRGLMLESENQDYQALVKRLITKVEGENLDLQDLSKDLFKETNKNSNRRK